VLDFGLVAADAWVSMHNQQCATGGPLPVGSERVSAA
jgi:hypothetical protein